MIKQQQAEAASGDSAADSFVDSMDEGNYVTVSLSKPMGVVFEENEPDTGGVFVASLAAGGAAATDGTLVEGDQLVIVGDTLVTGRDFDACLDVIRNSAGDATRCASNIATRTVSPQPPSHHATRAPFARLDRRRVGATPHAGAPERRKVAGATNTRCCWTEVARLTRFVTCCHHLARLIVFRGGVKNLYGNLGASEEWMQGFVASKTGAPAPAPAAAAPADEVSA